ncbi:latent-transforming growth factor beta-binding protein 1-like protein [Anopheles sinensis]|uniref:Latent-transforming growth factor beta-binding protein 1-like protein n=1 Tax=Anopheles sinensis TaxID=74873 RepID=A0A084VU94_ANOSI|nr:latent-transforming growth factor beta-binding protein 1-like protein [Anopheles sinensis]
MGNNGSKWQSGASGRSKGWLYQSCVARALTRTHSDFSPTSELLGGLALPPKSERTYQRTRQFGRLRSRSTINASSKLRDHQTDWRAPPPSPRAPLFPPEVCAGALCPEDAPDRRCYRASKNPISWLLRECVTRTSDGDDYDGCSSSSSIARSTEITPWGKPPSSTSKPFREPSKRPSRKV